jgi:hypothetical protein
MTQEPVKTALLFPWCPEVNGGQIIETTASPEVAMQLEFVELLDGWQLEGIAVGGHSHAVNDPDLRSLKLPPVAGGTAINITIRARNMSADRQRFPGAKIIGTVVR